MIDTEKIQGHEVITNELLEREGERETRWAKVEVGRRDGMV